MYPDILSSLIHIFIQSYVHLSGLCVQIRLSRFSFQLRSCCTAVSVTSASYFPINFIFTCVGHRHRRVQASSRAPSCFPLQHRSTFLLFSALITFRRDFTMDTLLRSEVIRVFRDAGSVLDDKLVSECACYVPLFCKHNPLHVSLRRRLNMSDVCLKTGRSSIQARGVQLQIYCDAIRDHARHDGHLERVQNTDAAESLKGKYIKSSAEVPKSCYCCLSQSFSHSGAYDPRKSK